MNGIFDKLPIEITDKIINNLDDKSSVSFQQTNKHFLNYLDSFELSNEYRNKYNNLFIEDKPKRYFDRIINFQAYNINYFPKNIRTLEINIKTVQYEKLDFTNLPNLNTLLLNVNDVNEINIYDLPNLEVITFACHLTTTSLLIKNLSKLKYLNISNNYSMPLILQNINNIECLLFTKKCLFNQSIDLSQLINLKRLIFSNLFNQLIDISNLVNLEEISFGEDFDQLVNFTNCIKLTSITFGKNYSHSIDYDTITNIKTLKFIQNLIYEQYIPFDKLKKIENITFPTFYPHIVDFNDNNFSNLKELNIYYHELNFDINFKNIFNLINLCELYLTIDQNIIEDMLNLNNLTNLQYLYIQGNFRDIKFDQCLKLKNISLADNIAYNNMFNVNLPINIFIKYFYKFNKNINLKNIVSFHLDGCPKFNSKIKIESENIRCLTINNCNNFNQKINLSKNNIKLYYIDISHCNEFNNFIKMPSNVEIIKIINCKKYNQPIDDIKYNKLHQLILTPAKEFNHFINFSKMPAMQNIHINSDYNHPIININTDMIIDLPGSFNSNIFSNNIDSLLIGETFNQPLILDKCYKIYLNNNNYDQIIKTNSLCKLFLKNLNISIINKIISGEIKNISLYVLYNEININEYKEKYQKIIPINFYDKNKIINLELNHITYIKHPIYSNIRNTELVNLDNDFFKQRIQRSENIT